MQKLTRLILFLFLVSGFSALVYEIVWVRWLTLLTGTTQQAVSIVLAIFFTGLGLGAFLAGKICQNIKKPILIYGLVEIFVGLWAFFSPFLVGILAKFSFSQINLLLGVAAFLLFPTILLGATLPLLVRTLGKNFIPALYGVNTVGGVLGVIVAGFFAPPILGLSQTLRLAGVLSFLVGICALVISSKIKILPSVSVPKFQIQNQKLQIKSNFILFVLLATGFASLTLEVLWTKLFVLLAGGSVFTFSTVLFVYLLGIAAGSLLLAKIKFKNPTLIFFLALTGTGVGVIAALFFFDKLPFWLVDILQQTSDNFWLLAGIEAGIVVSVIFAPTFLSGITFPLAIRLLAQDAAKGAGYALGINTFGSVLGSIAAGFFLIPLLGLQKSILAIGLVYLALAIFVLLTIVGIRKGLILALIVFGLSSFFLPSWNKEVLTSGVYTNSRSWLDNKEGAKLTFYKEGLYGTVTVRRFPNGVQVLQINGKNEASSDFDADAASLLGHLPLSIYPEAKNVLLVGLGGGFTLDSITDYPISEIDVVEIEPAVVEAATRMSQVNGRALQDERVEVLINDGRRHLAGSNNNKKYDVIISQPSNPWLTGVSNLFTQEYYQLAKERLTASGIMASWLQLYGIPSQDLKIALATFSKVFPNFQVWTNLTGSDLILIGSQREIPKPFVKTEIARLEIDNQDEIEAYSLLNNQELKNLVAETNIIHSDNFPILEFSGPKTLYSNTTKQNLELIKNIRKLRVDKWGTFRDLLISGQILQLSGDFDSAKNAYKKVLAIDPQNRQVARVLADVMLAQAGQFKKAGKVEEALALFDEVKKVYPEGFLAWRNKGETLLTLAKSGAAFSLPQVAKAEQELLQAVKLAEYDASTHISLGIIAGIYGDYSRAEKELARAIEINPNDEFAWNNLAKAYYDQGQKQEARKAWRQSLKINPNQPEIRKLIER